MRRKPGRQGLTRRVIAAAHVAMDEHYLARKAPRGGRRRIVKIAEPEPVRGRNAIRMGVNLAIENIDIAAGQAAA